MKLSILVSSLLLVAACGRPAPEVPKEEPLTVDPAEVRILRHAGNSLPPDSGGFDYNYSLLLDVRHDRIDIYYSEDGRRPGNQVAEKRWMSELRGKEFDDAMALIRSTRWMPQKDAPPSGSPSVGGGHDGISIYANNGRYEAAGPAAAWLALAETLEKRALSSE